MRCLLTSSKGEVSSIPSITVDVLSRSVPASVLWVAPPMLIVENVKSAAPMAVVGFARKLQVTSQGHVQTYTSNTVKACVQPMAIAQDPINAALLVVGPCVWIRCQRNETDKYPVL